VLRRGAISRRTGLTDGPNRAKGAGATIAVVLPAPRRRLVVGPRIRRLVRRTGEGEDLHSPGALGRGGDSFDVEGADIGEHALSAGSAASRKNASIVPLPGVMRMSKRATSEVTRYACGTPGGTETKPPAASDRSSPSR
jgi:hypothetical protein